MALKTARGGSRILERTGDAHPYAIPCFLGREKAANDNLEGSCEILRELEWCQCVAFLALPRVVLGILLQQP
jgi:hypothetical protein